MDTDRLEDLGVKPAQDLLAKVGGWPVLQGEGWDADGIFAWYESMYAMESAGLNSHIFASLSVETDLRDSGWRVIYLDQPSLGLSREHLVKGLDNSPQVAAYLQFMVDTAMLLGDGELDRATVEAEMLQVLNLEIDLAKASMSKEARRNLTALYNPVLIGKFESLEGHPPSWTAYVNQLLGDVHISSRERGIIADPEYFKR